MGVQMRGRIAAILAFLLVGVLALSGCGGSAGALSGSSSDNALVGEWVGENGSTIKFTEDVFYTNAKDEKSTHYRYAVLDDESISLTPIVEKNGVEFDDDSKTRTEHYNLKSDTLNLESYGSGYHRAGTPEAEAASKSKDDASAKKECEAYRGRVALQMTDALSTVERAAYEKDGDYKNSPFVYDNPVDGGIAIGVKDESKNMTFDEMRDFLVNGNYLQILSATDEGRVVGAGETGEPFKFWAANDTLKCPSGGTFTLKGWEPNAQYGSNVYPVFECSVHGEIQSN